MSLFINSAVISGKSNYIEHIIMKMAGAPVRKNFFQRQPFGEYSQIIFLLKTLIVDPDDSGKFKLTIYC